MPKVYMDEAAAEHVTQRIRERIKNPFEQSRMVDAIKKMLTMEAPLEAVGHYSWHVNVEMIGRVVCQGHMIRTVLSYSENYPGGSAYSISKDGFVRG